MNLQSTFYTLGIISMVLYLLILIAIAVAVFIIKNKISDALNQVSGKVKTVKDLAKHPQDVAAGIGAAVASTAFETITRPKHKKSSRKKR